MIILTIRTDKPEAEVGLYQDGKQLAYYTWQAHRALAETLHTTIADLFEKHNLRMEQVNGIVCFKGPGSFTGLRIGLTVANALAYALGRPVIGAMGDDWIEAGIVRLQNGDNDTVAMPEYGADVHITQPKH